MKTAALAATALVARIASAVGIEGAFLAIGTIGLSVGSSFFSPAGPWLVVGGMAVFVGLALVLPRSR